MLANYAGDERITLTTVVFISAELAKIIMAKIIEPLKKIEPEYFYYPTASMHLTIKNVRTINEDGPGPLFTEEEAIRVDNLFKKIVTNFQSFDFTLQGLMPFATSISLMGYSDERLKQLVQGLDQGLKAIGVPDNKRYFSNEIFFGNISLCRFTHQPGEGFLAKVRELEDVFIGELPIKEINLITCNNVCRPDTKRVIGTYKLK
jgi:2'-5' RNA ligase